MKFKDITPEDIKGFRRFDRIKVVGIGLFTLFLALLSISSIARPILTSQKNNIDAKIR